MKQKPVILWGEHRSTEKLPLDIKDRLESDPEIKDKVVFVEHELWEKSDHLSLASRWDNHYREAYGITDLERSFGKFISEVADREARKIVEKYEERLYKKHRPLIFNLHSFSGDESSPDILFCLNEELLSDNWLREVILSTASKNGVNIQIGELFLYQHEKHSLISLIEFSLEQSVAFYPNKETENFAKWTGWLSYFACDNVNHPLYRDAINNYSGYMKDFLLSITEKI